ncbi:hypothetical protein SAMN05421594_0942 [Chryseobacterium oleae]|uniref:Uncharacterized protein n=1 Tax=Chryseobacterium oleae TaxID=491207 RepID=A0A1I4W5L5_CHROL|nr:hypothetical protein SAMN05421594_0942 [Chryseobacterium oleae]
MLKNAVDETHQICIRADYTNGADFFTTEYLDSEYFQIYCNIRKKKARQMISPGTLIHYLI